METEFSSFIREPNALEKAILLKEQANKAYKEQAYRYFLRNLLEKAVIKNLLLRFCKWHTLKRFYCGIYVLEDGSL